MYFSISFCMQPYTDLFIDFDDTLYDTHGNAVVALNELYELFHLETYFDEPEIFYNAFWKTNVELWSRYAKNEITKEQLIVDRFKIPLSVSEKASVAWLNDDYCLRMSHQYLELCASKPGVVEGAHELMNYLWAKRYRLHLCSNGFHEVQYKKLKVSGLFPFFDTIVLSEDAGANKPSPLFFDYAFLMTKARRETTLMIGDNYYTDMEGAINAGIDCLFLNRWDATFIPPQAMTYQVNTLHEIMQIL